MANPTTNYGFVLPTPTDLVTDLPADFDIALQGVDTRLKALQPGTTSGDLAYSSATANTNVRLGIGTAGQVLAVVSGVPAWATTADQTPLTTKGDVFTFSTVDARLPVGTNGQVLTCDSTQSTGLKYATPSAAAFSGALISRSTQQSITTSTSTAISFDNEFFDVGAYHDNTNPTRLTVPTTGKYQLNFQTSMTGTTGRLIVIIQRNGAEIAKFENGNNSSLSGMQASQIYSATAADYFEFFVFQSSGSTQNTEAGNLHVQASIVFLGA